MKIKAGFKQFIGNNFQRYAFPKMFLVFCNILGYIQKKKNYSKARCFLTFL